MFDVILRPGLPVMLTADIWKAMEKRRKPNAEALERLRMGDTLWITGMPSNLKERMVLSEAMDGELQIHVPINVVGEAREFYISQQELERHGEGVSTPLFIGLWLRAYRELPTEEERKAFQSRLIRGSWQDNWPILTSFTEGFK